MGEPTMTQQGQVPDGWHDISTAPKDGTHIIGNTQWGAREIWWHKDAYEGEYWTDEGDSEPAPTGWIPKPGSVPTSLAGQGTDGYVLVPRSVIASLAAKDAELAEVRQLYVDANEARIDAEAALAEARKALAALDRMSRGVDWCDQDEQARRWSAARRALEQQTGS